MTGLGWPRLAAAVAEQMPAAEVDGIWVFSPLRHDGREWGTAVLSRVDGERRRIYTVAATRLARAPQWAWPPAVTIDRPVVRQ